MFTQRVIPNSGAERIGFIRSRVHKTPIRYETESGTLVDPVSCKQGLIPLRRLLQYFCKSAWLVYSRLMITKEKSLLTGPEIFVVVFSHVKEEDSVKK